MISNIIFSKDRAMQLDLLLQSIERFAPSLFSQTIIQYNYDNDQFKAGYEKLKQKYPHIMYVEDSARQRTKENPTFKKDFEKVLALTTQPYLTIMVDDGFFYKDIDQHKSEILTALADETVFAFLLGVGGDSSYSDILRYTYRQPQFEQIGLNTLKWNWKRADRGEFACPFMLVGNIWRKN
jgi:hypothetical protein